MNIRRITLIAAVALVVSFSTVVVLLTLDWATKYSLYVQQRDALYDLIRYNPDSEKIDALKKTVAYLQGTATRRANDIKETSLYFAPTLAVYYCLWKLIRRDDSK